MRERRNRGSRLLASSAAVSPRAARCSTISARRVSIRGLTRSPAHRRDAAQPARARALEQPHQDRLGLVVRGMPGRDARRARGVGRARERGVARPPALRLEPVPGRSLPDRDPLDPAGHSEPLAEPLDRRRLRVRLRAQAVVHVGHRQREIERGREARRARRGARPSPARPRRPPRHLRRHGAFRGGEWCPGRARQASDDGHTETAGPPTPRRPRSAPSSRWAPSPSGCRWRSGRPRRPHPDGARRSRS